MILAATELQSVNPVTFKDVVIILLAGLSAAVMIRQFFRGRTPEPREIHPQPLQVQGVEKLATDKECVNRHQEVLKQMEKLQAERKKDVSDLHEKVNKVDREVAGLSKATDLQNQTLSQISSKLDRIAEGKHGR